MLTWNKFLVYGFSSHISLFYIIGNKLLSCLNKMVIRWTQAPSAWGHYFLLYLLLTFRSFSWARPHNRCRWLKLDKMLYITATMVSYCLSISVSCSRKCSASIPAEELQPGLLLNMNTSRISGLYPDWPEPSLCDCVRNVYAFLSFCFLFCFVMFFASSFLL